MINHATDIIPKFLVKELLRLGRLDRNWVRWKSLDPGNHEGRYTCDFKHETWLKHLMLSGADGFAMWASSVWLVDGPKIFRPTLEQCEALEQIEVKLELHEYAQPYPAILIDLPEYRYGLFSSVLCHRSENMLTCVTHSLDHVHDITTTIAVDGRPIETSLQKFDEDAFHCMLHGHDTFKPGGAIQEMAEKIDIEGAGNQITTSTNIAKAFEQVERSRRTGTDFHSIMPHPVSSDEAAICGKALRVAVNSCLALVNFGCYHQYLFKEEAKRSQGQLEREQKGGKEASLETRNRVRLAPRIVNFVKEVILHKTSGGQAKEGTGESGREMPTHWRRGHWHTVLHGAGKSQRKLKLFPPVLVRSDRITDQERITTVYRSPTSPA